MNMKKVMADIERTLFYSDVGPGSGIAVMRNELDKCQSCNGEAYDARTGHRGNPGI